MEKYGFKMYEKAENVINTDILKKDKITFSVLLRIVNNKCNKVFTDGERIIICYSNYPFPVWVWTADDVTEDELIRINSCLKAEFPVGDGYEYVILYELFDKLKELDEVYRSMKIYTNLLSYQCEKTIKPHKKCDGKMRQAKEEDYKLLVKYHNDMAGEVHHSEFPWEESENIITNGIAEKAIYVWENDKGEIVATVSRRKFGDTDSLSMFYTIPSERRKGYAENLVYSITEMIIEEGMLPTLYTDADYGASNSCYKKLGYIEVGSLYTIGK